MAALTPIQEVRVLFHRSLEAQALDPAMVDLMMGMIREANKRMQPRIDDGDFPHPSLMDPADYTGSLVGSKDQHTLALLRHLLDCLNRQCFDFGVSNDSIEYRRAECRWMTMCLSIICIPCSFYYCRKIDAEMDAIREANRQALLELFSNRVIPVRKKFQLKKYVSHTCLRYHCQSKETKR